MSHNFVSIDMDGQHIESGTDGEVNKNSDQLVTKLDKVKVFLKTYGLQVVSSGLKTARLGLLEYGEEPIAGSGLALNALGDLISLFQNIQITEEKSPQLEHIRTMIECVIELTNNEPIMNRAYE